MFTFEYGCMLTIYHREYRLEICQIIYTTGFLGQKFYTLKVRKFIATIFTHNGTAFKCINISNLSNSLLEFN